MSNNDSDDRNVLSDIGDDPIAAAEALQEEIGGVRKQLYFSLAKAVAITEVLEVDDQKWAAFKAHVARQGLHVGKSPLRAVMCFVFKAKKPSGPAYERSCCYTRAIKRLREDQSVVASDIPKLIMERGGIEELYAEAKTLREVNEGNSADSGSNLGNDSGQDAEQSSDTRPTADEAASKPASAVTNNTGLRGGGKEPPRKPGGTAGDDEPRKFTKAWCEQRLIFESLPATQTKALNMRHRQRGSLDFIYSGNDETGFKIFYIGDLRLK